MDLVVDYSNLDVILRQIHLGMEYGAPIKCADDLLRYRAILDAVQPRMVVETGLAFGASARWFCSFVEEVVSIENDPEKINGFNDAPLNLTVLGGDSLDPIVVGLATKMAAKYQPVVVSLDSTHTDDHVRRELDAYAPLATSGSYLVVEDTFRHFCPDVSPDEGDAWQACCDFLTDHPEFVRDTDIETLTPFTLNPMGWLRRL